MTWHRASSETSPLVAIRQLRWMVLAALAATVPRAARAQSAQPERTTPVYSPPTTPANPPPSTSLVPSAEPVHRGIYLRLHLGAGFDSFSVSGGASGSAQLSGSGPAWEIALGGALARNFAIYGTVFQSVLAAVSLKTTRMDLTSSSGAAVAGLGAGAVYYVEPINVYLSGAIAVTALTVGDARGDTIDESDGGIAFQTMAGKEWWVSKHWGLGAAVEILVASMKDRNDQSASWTTGSFNALFSASCF